MPHWNLELTLNAGILGTILVTSFKIVRHMSRVEHKINIMWAWFEQNILESKAYGSDSD